MASEREMAVSKNATTAGDAKLREAIERIRSEAYECDQSGEYLGEGSNPGFDRIVKLCDAALAAPPHTGKWKNGKEYEYEYAYCSECGHMQWAGWNSHEQAEEHIESFADNYRFCPCCGAKMEGGVYVK